MSNKMIESEARTPCGVVTCPHVKGFFLLDFEGAIQIIYLLNYLCSQFLAANGNQTQITDQNLLPEPLSHGCCFSVALQSTITCIYW